MSSAQYLSVSFGIVLASLAMALFLGDAAQTTTAFPFSPREKVARSAG